jgi:tRNA threonylcarbamoyladenosine biosynthesis protein TsaE
MEIITNSSNQTKKLGEALAKKIKSRKKNKALVLGLSGDLGGGKTTFLQGFAKGLGIKKRVLSPTFLIMKKFELNNSTIRQFSNFYHFDCYRIKKSKEILDLGFKKITSDPKNIVAVEWAERIKKIMPRNTIWIKFEFIDENKRKIRISKLLQTSFLKNNRGRII